MSTLMQSNDWHNKYCRLAKEISTWSKDPSTQIGAVVVGEDGQILSQGFNGFPRGINDSEERLNNRERKYELVVHGEMNAIYNATLNGVSLKNSTMYVYGLPTCNECAKGIIQVGIKKVVVTRPYLKHNKNYLAWEESIKNAKAMFKEAGVMYLIEVEELCLK